MIHGRFQPFHNGHLEYLMLALERCETLLVGITNPDPTQTAEEKTSDHRHLAESNPYTFFERLLMIRETVIDQAIPLARVVFIPFPVNLPDLWRYYVPPDVVHYVRVFSPWEQAKVERLRGHGYQVQVLQPGASKEIEATEVRRRLQAGDDWRSLVPAGVARVIEGLPGRT
jgi:nicotinamide-nucleotide adenylyltransferase